MAFVVSLDSSGNENNWSSTNMASHDVSLDTPQNNFCALNLLHTNAGAYQTLSQGNLKHTADANYSTAVATMGVKYGKWYWEIKIVTNEAHMAGIIRGTSSAINSYVGYDYNNWKMFGYSWQSATSGWIYGDTGTGTTQGNTLAQPGRPGYNNTDIVGLAVDIPSGTLKFYRNNSLEYTITSINSYDWIPAVSGYGTSAHIVVNFGQNPSFSGEITAGTAADENGIGKFKYAPPSGYLALCTANLPDPAIILPEEHFKTVIYTGADTAANRSVTGVGFQPDLVWGKSRSDQFYHNWYDAVRGVGRRLVTNNDDAETTNHAYGYISSFDSDGFTTTAGSTNNENFNKTSSNYVAWNWKANGAGSSNSEGDEIATVSANTAAGFSIVKYTSGGVDRKVGHGLGVKPDIILQRNRAADSWYMYTDLIDGSPDAVNFDMNAAGYATSNHPVPDATEFHHRYSTSAEIIAYCWASIEGYSKMGIYDGTSLANGPFVYTGFRPAMIISKRVDSTDDWEILDNTRNTTNDGATCALWPGGAGDTAWEESCHANYAVDFVSNGFKLRGSHAVLNDSGGTYLFMAFAEAPFKYANAR